MNFNIRRLSLGTAERLVNHNARMRQGISFPFCTRCQKHRRHGCTGTDTNRRYFRTNILHRIINGKTGRDDASRAVNVKMDILIRIFRFQEKKLGNNDIGRVVIYRTVKEYNSVF